MNEGTGKKILRRACPAKSQKANEEEARLHSAAGELDSLPCCLKLTVQGSKSPLSLGRKLERAKHLALPPLPTLAPS
jgi:hypothetical protein